MCLLGQSQTHVLGRLLRGLLRLFKCQMRPGACCRLAGLTTIEVIRVSMSFG